MTAGWGPRRTGVRRGLTDPAATVPDYTPAPSDGYGTCGHLIASHDIRKDGARGKCSHMDGENGQCPCPGCEVVEVGS